MSILKVTQSGRAVGSASSQGGAIEWGTGDSAWPLGSAAVSRLGPQLGFDFPLETAGGFVRVPHRIISTMSFCSCPPPISSAFCGLCYSVVGYVFLYKWSYSF